MSADRCVKKEVPKGEGEGLEKAEGKREGEKERASRELAERERERAQEGGKDDHEFRSMR